MRAFLPVLLLLAGCHQGGELSQSLAVDEPEPVGDVDEDDLEPCASLELGAEGAFIPQGGAVLAVRPRCFSGLHATAGAGGSTIELSLRGWPGEAPASLRVVDLIGAPLAEGTLFEGGTMDVVLPRTAEVWLELWPQDPDAPTHDYELAVRCLTGCDREFSRYPIVLMHGMAGAESYFDAWTYFYEVRPLLEQVGYAVFTPAVDGLAPSSLRSEQWTEHLDALQAEGWGRRFHLLGHSQGGVDARYMATVLGGFDRIASITTVATPHGGSELADAASGLLDLAPDAAELLEEAVSELTQLIGLGEAELLAATDGMTTSAMDEFNEDVPDHPDVRYFSWSARSCGVVEMGCREEMNGEIVAAYLIPSYRLLQLLAGDNDGIVPTDSAVWGEHLGTLGADHFDEVGQLAGETSDGFNHRAFYLGEARRLKDLGL